MDFTSSEQARQEWEVLMRSRDRLKAELELTAKLMAGIEAQLLSRDATIKELREALTEISKGQGRFSMDNEQFARNTIEDMIALAHKALSSLAEREKEVGSLSDGQALRRSRNDRL